MLEAILKNILNMSVEASFLIVAVLFVRILLRKSSKLFRKVLWALVALRLSLPFSFESSLSLVPHQSKYMAEVNTIPTDGAVVVTDSAFDWTVIVPYVWVTVCALFLVYAITCFVKLKRKMSDAVRFKDNVFQSEKVDSPFVFGVVKPRIYVSYDIKGEDLDFVLKHENTHIKYFDHITKIIGFVILCVHWFNPLVWISYALFCKDTELACDELVIRNMTADKRKSYARTLYDIGVSKPVISACPIAFGEVSIKERVKTAVSYKKIGKVALALSAVICVMVAVCFMTSPKSGAVEPPVNTEVAVNETINYAPKEEDTTSVIVEQKEEPVENDVQLPEEIIDEVPTIVIENNEYYDGLKLSPEYHGKASQNYNPYGVENGNSTISNTMPVIKWDNVGNPGKYAGHNPPNTYNPSFQNNKWVGWDY